MAAIGTNVFITVRKGGLWIAFSISQFAKRLMDITTT